MLESVSTVIKIYAAVHEYASNHQDFSSCYCLVENARPATGVQVLAETEQSKTSKLTLCLDRALATRLEPVQLFAIGETEFLITLFDPRRLAKVYEKTTGITVRTDFKVKAGRLCFAAPVTGEILCVPHGRLELYKALAASHVQQLWLDSRGIYSYRNLQLSSFDSFTEEAEGLEFSLSSTGPWTSSLSCQELPDSLYVRIPPNYSPSLATAIRISVNRFL